MEAAISKKKEKGRGAAVVKPAAKVRDYRAHVLVCTGGDCKKRGAKDTKKALKAGIRSEGLLGETRLDTVNCLGICKHGPNVVVYDSTRTWYLGLNEKDAPEIVEQHLRDSEPVSRLAVERWPRKKR